MKKSNKVSKYFSGDVDDDDDVQSLYCQDWCSKSLEGWNICSKRRNCAQSSRAGVDSDDDEAVRVCSQCDS